MYDASDHQEATVMSIFKRLSIHNWIHAGCYLNIPTFPPDLDFLMEALQGFAHVFNGNQHVLDDLVLLIHVLDGLALGKLEQGDLGGHHPAKQVAKHWVVSKGDDILPDNLYTAF